MRNDHLKKTLSERDLKEAEQRYPSDRGYNSTHQLEGVIADDLLVHRLLFISMRSDEDLLLSKIKEFVEQLKSDGLITANTYEHKRLTVGEGGYWDDVGYYDTIALGEFRQKKLGRENDI